MADEKELELDDPTITAAIVQFGCIAETFLRPSGKVAFKVKGPVQSALSRIYANDKIPIMDFIKEIKSLRNSIFILRSTMPGNRQETRK